MKSLDFGRYALSSCVAAAMLSGCGGSQPPLGSPGAMTQSRAITTHAAHGKSWMLPDVTDKLLYVAVGNDDVSVLSYPQGNLVGKLAVSQAWGLCSDTNGDVFVTEYYQGQVVEYAHGGTSPINTLVPPGQPLDCSSDPTTGNLAVVLHGINTIAIFQGAQGTPQTYTDSDFAYFDYCAYDDTGRLFIDGPTGPISAGLTDFNTKRGTFKNIRLNEDLNAGGELQWDGKYLAINSGGDPYAINQVEISRSSGKIVGTTSLIGRALRGGWSWIHGNTFIMPLHDNRRLGFWSYPAGGKPVRVLSRADFKSKGPIRGMTVSVAPSR
jgi:hypothetical protein